MHDNVRKANIISWFRYILFIYAILLPERTNNYSFLEDASRFTVFYS